MLTTYGGSDAKDVWFDLLNPTENEISRAQAACALTIPSRDKLSEIESSSRVSDVAGVFYLSMPFVASAQGVDDLPSPVGFVLSENALVTVRYSPLRSFDAVAAMFSQADHRPAGAVETFAALIGQMVDASADLLEQLGRELDTVSLNVFPKRKGRHHRPKSNATLRNILIDVGNAGERLSHIRESMLGLQRIVPFVYATKRPWIGDKIIEVLKSAQTDLISLADYEAQLYGKVQFLLDAVLGFITTKQNDIFTVLTVVSVVGIPPTLVASIYGMNFKHMPELDWTWGYPYALGLIVLSTILPLLWFKWRGWL